MKRDDLLSRLRSLQPWLQRSGVARLRVFGSHARDEARPDSDIDLLVEFAPGHIPNLFAFAGLKLELEARLGSPVDLITPRAIHPALRERIEAAAIDA